MKTGTRVGVDGESRDLGEGGLARPEMKIMAGSLERRGG